LISFKNLILSIRGKTRMSLKTLAKEIGVSESVIQNIVYERYGQTEPKFSDGVILIDYAKEVGADLTRVFT